MAQALVVDDSRTVRKLLAQTLLELGFGVEEAENGKEALAVLEARQTPVDLVLTDWNMPEMNGLDFLKKLRAQDTYKHIPVLMVTTETEMDYIASALEAGATEYVMKPFTREVLEGKLLLAGVRV